MRNDDNNVKAAQQALDELVKVAGACEDSDQLHTKAADILSKLANHPGVIDRVCDAFNSNKALYKLSSADAEVRGGDFALIDKNRIHSQITKTASAREMKKLVTLKPRFYSNTKPEKQPTEQVKKTASAFNPAACIELNTAPGMLTVTINNVLNRVEDTFQKLAHAVEEHSIECEIAVDAVTREATHMSKQAKAETKSIGSAYYGELFASFDKTFDTDLPLRKFASTPVCPNTPVFQKIAHAVECEYVRDNTKALLKQAAADTAELLRKLAGAYNLYRIGMRKSASIADTMVGAAIGSTFDEVPTAFGLDTDKKSEREKVLNANVSNALRELETRRNFYEVYNDPYISTFPMEQVQDAYNSAIQKLPERLKAHPSSAVQLIRSWVTKTLSHGGVTSAEDAADVLEAASKMRFENMGASNPFMKTDEED
jgi:hypothetical protein